MRRPGPAGKRRKAQTETDQILFTFRAGFGGMSWAAESLLFIFRQSGARMIVREFVSGNVDCWMTRKKFTEISMDNGISFHSFGIDKRFVRSHSAAHVNCHARGSTATRACHLIHMHRLTAHKIWISSTHVASDIAPWPHAHAHTVRERVVRSVCSNILCKRIKPHKLHLVFIIILI